MDTDAGLGPLIGSPGYHAIASTSPAVDGGNPAGCTNHLGSLMATDQRGEARMGVCDIGAYEYTAPGSAAEVSAVGGTPRRTPPPAEFDDSLRAIVLDDKGSPVNGVTVDFTAPSSGASGTFADSGTETTSALADEHVVAMATILTANSAMGDYAIEATTVGVGTPGLFDLSNTAWYVSTGGDDANNCATVATACSSINGALGKPGFIPGDPVLAAIGTYILTYYNKRDNVGGAGALQVRVTLRYTDGTTENFNYVPGVGTQDWQEYTEMFTAAKDYDWGVVRLIYSKPNGTLWYDDMSLRR